MAAERLEIHPEALEEIKSALLWYRDRSETAASCFVEEVDGAIALIVQSPNRWPAGRSGTRKYVLRRFPFAVVYRIAAEAIQVLAVAHGHRRPGYWKNRL
jgi:plasmid stabilization system protein ParE